MKLRDASRPGGNGWYENLGKQSVVMSGKQSFRAPEGLGVPYDLKFTGIRVDDGKDDEIDRVRVWKLKDLESKAARELERQELVGELSYKRAR